MKIKEILLVFILCMIGSFINDYIPGDWKYNYGFIVGMIVANVIYYMVQNRRNY